MRNAYTSLILLVSMLISACSYNPFGSSDQTTGTAVGAGTGAAVGVGTAAVFGASKPALILAGVGGGMLGYYLTTLRYDSRGVIHNNGKVFIQGDYIGIYIPTDDLFEVNTADFLPEADAIIASAADVLKRNPNNNIIVSGNTSGFDMNKRELALSQRRAQKIAAALWDAGINNFQGTAITTRKLTYVGYGDYLPISSNLTNKGIRENSRIQITSYPCDANLQIDKNSMMKDNIGALNDTRGGRKMRPCGEDSSCYKF